VLTKEFFPVCIFFEHARDFTKIADFLNHGIRTANKSKKEKEISPFFVIIFFMSYYVYILYSAKLGKLYFGSTKDVALRLSCHNSGGAKYTSKGLPWELLYSLFASA